MVTITLKFESGYMEDSVVKVIDPITAWKIINLIAPTKFISKQDFIDRWTIMGPLDRKGE